MKTATPQLPIGTANHGRVDLCYETFGSPHDPAIILLAGGQSSMLFWSEDFCQYLKKNRRYVIRYDYRDTGKSLHYPPGAPPYKLADFADDVLQIMDECLVEKANLVGFSMGSGICQLLALRNPDRVVSLTLMSSGPVGAYPGEKDLPQMAPELLQRFIKLAPQDSGNREEVINSSVEIARLCAGSGYPIDEVESRALAAAVFDRDIDLRSSMNHGPLNFERWQRERLGEITAPTLVFHGMDDQVLPFVHGVALSKEIKNAKLIPLEGVGHDLPRGVWDIVLPALLAHTMVSASS
ncbi:alpha/beta-hydrolase [Hyaloscypha variabilis F]|uniref:Alpha/beta-hydrolase n=1 Tax=Hyaloscypha variabilis (strain UAMH 11265 / GT02V1 / F) TaxID=1149755 RepID=A0A2J6QUA0_HYAVF|nr:alpha/beta-hydrolase [Hyaloscypha variabilis F]